MTTEQRTPAEVNAAYDQAPCPNCDDGCTAARFCDGCDEVLCDGCWTCHNTDDHETCPHDA